MIQVDRSRILDGQACLRKRFLGYHYLGKGIQKKLKALPLVFGAAFHEGCEFLLRGDVEQAVAKAQQYLNGRFLESGVDLDTTEAHISYGISEQMAIVEGLLRAWWITQGEKFLNDFEVIEVEQEGVAQLVEGAELLFRPDALVRERQSGDLYIVSWKTTSRFGQWTLDQCAVDMQSMSEVWGREQYRVTSGTDNVAKLARKIEGVLYLFCVKGQRRMDDYLGFKTQRTPLAYGWKRLNGAAAEETEWAHSWSYVNEDTGKGTTLGKGWKLVPVWEEYPGGVKAWIEALSRCEIRPRHVDALGPLFPQSLPVSRRADEIEDWLEQTIASEERIHNSARVIELTERTGADIKRALNVHFPQSTARCFDYASKCQFYDICWKPAVGADPMLSGLYQIRVPNHVEKGSDGDE